LKGKAKLAQVFRGEESSDRVRGGGGHCQTFDPNNRDQHPPRLVVGLRAPFEFPIWG